MEHRKQAEAHGICIAIADVLCQFHGFIRHNWASALNVTTTAGNTKHLQLLHGLNDKVRSNGHAVTSIMRMTSLRQSALKRPQAGPQNVMHLKHPRNGSSFSGFVKREITCIICAWASSRPLGKDLYSCFSLMIFSTFCVPLWYR